MISILNFFLFFCRARKESSYTAGARVQEPAAAGGISGVLDVCLVCASPLLAFTFVLCGDDACVCDIGKSCRLTS